MYIENLSRVNMTQRYAVVFSNYHDLATDLLSYKIWTGNFKQIWHLVNGDFFEGLAI